MPSAKLYYVWPFPGLLSGFFSLIESEISEQASRQVATEEPNKGFFYKARRRNVRYYNLSRNENAPGENEMDSPSFRGFHT